MGQKVHPLGFRLGINQKHQNYWHVRRHYFSIWVQDAIFIRKYLEHIFIEMGLINIEIRRIHFEFSNIDILIHLANPNMLLYSKFPALANTPKKERTLISQLNALTNDLIVRLQNYYKKRYLPIPPKIFFNIKLQPEPNSFISANIIAQTLVNDLEKRKHFKKALSDVVEKAKSAGIKGIKIKLSGRINGIDKARIINYQWGAVPLHTLRAKIDYSQKSAKTIYGLFGVKVWVFHGESLNKLNNL